MTLNKLSWLVVVISIVGVAVIAVMILFAQYDSVLNHHGR
jgi:hypothetical protein